MRAGGLNLWRGWGNGGGLDGNSIDGRRRQEAASAARGPASGSGSEGATAVARQLEPLVRCPSPPFCVAE